MAKSVYERFGKSALSGQVQSGRRWPVRGGDTLQSIAAQVYPEEGYSSDAWRQIYEANTDRIDDIMELEIGIVLVIPSLKTAT
jgi:nucleoid-associated protein YgaU